MKYSLKNSVLGAALFTGVVFGVNANATQTWINFDFDSTTGAWEAAFANNKLTLTAGHFSDDYFFKLPASLSQEGGASVISNYFKGAFNVDFSNFSLWDDTTSTLIGGGPTSGVVSTFDFGPIGPSADTFRLHVAGDVVGLTVGAGYAGNVTISPVPEPETYAMLLAGLGLIGFSVRRRVA